MKKNNSKGITLIALIITIIVMLILAGVSINAIIGDNGVITNAQNASIAQSCAVLEEYLHEKYVELSSDKIADSSLNNKKPLEVLLETNSTRGYFYSPFLDSNIGGSNYILDGDGNIFYLIKKNSLPEDIREQIKGGQAGSGAGTYEDYQSLVDVYGVTLNLKVYYCSEGKDSIFGAAVADLDIENVTKVVLGNSGEEGKLYNLISYLDVGNKNSLTVTDVLSVTELYIKETDELPRFSDFYLLPNLTKIIIENKNGSSFDGIQYAPKIDFIDLRGCTFTDYKAIGNLSKLSSFYLYNIDDVELGKICSKDKGIGNAKLTNLRDLAITGNNSDLFCTTLVSWANYYEDPADAVDGILGGGVTVSKSLKTISSLSPLKNLQFETTSYVDRLCVNHNNITSLDGLQNFNNLTYLNAGYNALENVSYIKDLTNLNKLFINSNNIVSLPFFSVGSNLQTIYFECNTGLTTLDGLQNCNNLDTIYANNCNLTDITAIANLKNMRTINLRGNINLINIDCLASTSSNSKVQLSFISLLELLNIEGISNIKKEINNATKKHIPTIYSLSLLDDNSSYLKLDGESVKINVFKDLKQYSEMTKVQLSDIKLLDSNDQVITDSTVINNAFAEAIGGWKKIQYLSLVSNRKLTDVSFIKTNQLTDLLELDLRGSGVTDVSFLEEMTTDPVHPLHLCSLGIWSYGKNASNEEVLIDVDLSCITKTISGLNGTCYWLNTPNTVSGGLVTRTKYVNTLDNSDITNLRLGYPGGWRNDASLGLHLSGCGNLTSLTYQGYDCDILVPRSLTYIETWDFDRHLFPNGSPNLEYYYMHGPQFRENGSIQKFASIDTFVMGWGFGSRLYDSCLWSYDLTILNNVRRFIGRGSDSSYEFSVSLPSQLEYFAIGLEENLSFTGNGCKINSISCGGLTSSNLSRIYIRNANIPVCDLTDFPALTSISLVFCSIANITFNENNIISEVKLGSNRLSSLHSFSNLKKATYIDILNNSLLVNKSGFKVDGTNDDELNVDIIASLNPGADGATSEQCLLTKFFATGCTGVTNWSSLSDSKYTWTSLQY